MGNLFHGSHHSRGPRGGGGLIMNKATLKYRWWNVYEFPPEGWVIDENTGSPLCGHDFYTNGKSPLNGQKRALVMSKKLTHEQREHVKELLQEKLLHGTLLSIK